MPALWRVDAPFLERNPPVLNGEPVYPIYTRPVCSAHLEAGIIAAIQDAPAGTLAQVGILR